EQHGPHAPMGTDTLSAEAIADRAAEAYDGTALVTPAVPIGISEEHRQFTGTLWVEPDTFRDYVRETVASLAGHGVSRVVVVNGHGGNSDALREVCGTISRREAAYAVPFTWFDAVDFAAHGVELGHGGPAETAVVRALAPELIDEEELDAAAEGAGEAFGEFEHGTNLAFDFASFSEAGNVGDPRAGDAELGEALLEAATAALVEIVERVAARDTAPPPHR
ncbi:creatininase family protein, partial [Halapricum sp. CBA1109]|uniref:creatininase family protein n=1 Tax=Halapricum sp. CBA1109 TaxID=2668068 RepID=UPI0012F8A091